ncbi:MAG: anhydro-N-acetylmuramic acid kinase [Flavobacteriales bacterium]|nr:anhydro-N-acetylmuramic acid kinase [Flavobacteriales bacterium]
MERYSAIGIMSGSSLDGLDLAWCEFTVEGGHWAYCIREARTIPYPASMHERLIQVMNGTALELARLHRDLGSFIGAACAGLLGEGTVDVIASHGHTVFHKPDEGLTTQIGCGAQIAAVSGFTTVCDFRTMDVALGGQGAPLVPLGEQFLFPEHKAFLNIGGICNIALHEADKVVGYDVCIGNQALNSLAEEAEQPFDADGAIARSGKVDEALLAHLNALPFHHEPPPRSLGREWFEAEFRPLLSTTTSIPDRMRTVVEHIAQQVASASATAKSPLLVTGGGALNGFLMERIRALSKVPVVVPDTVTVEFKEALIFALLGVLRLRNGPTALASVTGAKKDSVGGAVYLGESAH